MARKNKNLVLVQGVDAFPENRDLIRNAHNSSMPTRLLLENHHPKYHGRDKAGCLLVRIRKELVNADIKNPHYLHIWGCLGCGIHHECLEGGWEIGWCGGTESRKLK